MVVKTGAKSSAERAPLRRLSSLEKKGGRKSSSGRIVKELKGIDAAKAVAPNYQRPTANSSNQARVLFKPLTQSPSPHFNKGRRSLGSESPDACKYGRKSSLLGSKTSEKNPVKVNRLKPSKSFEKTPVKINALKTSRAFDKSPVSLKLKTPKSDLSSKILNVARDTCSSNCKHVVKGRDLTASPEPRCPYHYCSLNHLDRVEPPSVKQFLASRRLLLRTQKSFKWVGLTPVLKGSGVGASSVDDRGPGRDTDIVVHTGRGVDIDSVVDTGQGLWYVGCEDNTREKDAADVWNRSDDDVRPEDCQIVDYDDYDDGLQFESVVSNGNDRIPVDEISMDDLEIKMEGNESVEFFAGDEYGGIDKHEIDIEAIDHEIADSSNDYDQLAESLVDASDVDMRAEESTEVFVKDTDGKDDDDDLDVEAFVYFQILESLVDNHDGKVRAEESLKQFAEDTNVKGDNHGVDVEESSNDMASDYHDYCQTEESLCLIQVNLLESEFCGRIEPDGLVEVPLSEVNSCLHDKVKDEDNCNLLSFEAELVSDVCTNDSILVREDDSDRSEESEVQCYIPLNHGTDCRSFSEPDCTPVVSLSLESKYLEGIEEEDYDCKSGTSVDDLEPRCFVQANILGPECNNSTEPDGLPDAHVSEVHSFLEDEAKEEYQCISGSSKCGSVSDGSDQSEKTEGNGYILANHGTEYSYPTESDHSPAVSCTLENNYLGDVVEEEYDCSSTSVEGIFVSEVAMNDHAELSVGCKDDYDQIEDFESQCFIQANGFGPECNNSTESDGTIDASVSEVIAPAELSVGCKDDYDQIEDSKSQCFIQANGFGPECNNSTEPDGTTDASVSEVIAPVKGEVEEDECISGSSECGSVSDDSDLSEKPELNCYVPVNYGIECSSPTESGHTPGVSCSLENRFLKDIVEEESDCNSGSVEGIFDSEGCPNDHLELLTGCKDDYDPIDDLEPHCFIRVNVFGPECNSVTEPDSLPDATLSEANSSFKPEVEKPDWCISKSSECGSVSVVSAHDLIEQSASFQDMCDQSYDILHQCSVLINTLETDCSSQRDSNRLANVPFSEVNSFPKDEAKEEHNIVSRSAGTETASEVNTDAHTKEFFSWEDDQRANGRSVNGITELDSNNYGEFSSSCAVDGNLNCHAKVDSPQNCSVIESCEGHKQVTKEEHIGITGSVIDGFDDDYNLTSLFAECKDDIIRECESNSPMQFNICTDVDSPVDNSPFESSISSKFDEGGDVHTVVGGEDDCGIETNSDDFEEQYSEYENKTNEIPRISNDFDDDHSMEYEVYNEMREEFCDESSLNGPVEYESLRSGLKGYKFISDENKNKPHRLKFRQGYVYPFDNQNSEAKKVDLRHQMTEERRAAHEWMLDYALTNIVKKLSPFRQRKVELLVEAFETVTPLSKCETNDLPQPTRAFTCSRPIQACN